MNAKDTARLGKYELVRMVEREAADRAYAAGRVQGWLFGGPRTWPREKLVDWLVRNGVVER